MKIKDLMEELDRCHKEYGKKFLDWDVYTEQCTEGDKTYKKDKKKNGGQGWKVVTDGDDWEYFECAGFWTKMPKEKIFTINVNY